MKSKLTKIIVAGSLILNAALVGGIGYVSTRVKNLELGVKAPVYIQVSVAEAAKDSQASATASTSTTAK